MKVHSEKLLLLLVVLVLELLAKREGIQEKYPVLWALPKSHQRLSFMSVKCVLDVIGEHSFVF